MDGALGKEIDTPLRPLLHFLDANRPGNAIKWQEWQIEPVIGGWNSLLYRASTLGVDIAIKFTVADERDRAGREYAALSAVTKCGLDITPRALFVDRKRFTQPVVVQSWVDGTVSTDLPQDDEEWALWAAHMASIHTMTSDNVAGQLRGVVLTAFSTDEAKALIDVHLDWIPLNERRSELSALVDRIRDTTFPQWTRPTPTLCRVDSAIQNFVRRSDRWYSVDWENAGWGDPAFEIADLLNHAANRAMTAERRRWFVERYCILMDDPTIDTRIWTYQKVMLVWWAVRTYRYLYEMPRGLDRRLARMPRNWEADIQTKYERYLALASTHF